MPKNQDFLTVKESANFTKRSEVTIRRLLSQLIEDISKNKALSVHLLINENPTEKSKYRISKQYLIDHFNITDRPDNQKEDIPKNSNESSAISKMMVEQLKNENQYLKSQVEFYQKQHEQTMEKVLQLIETQRQLTQNQQTLASQTNQIILSQTTGKKPIWKRLFGGEEKE